MDQLTTEYSRLLWAAVVLLAYLALCGRIWLRQHRQAVSNAPLADCILVGWASQGGAAQQLAEQLQHQLQAAGYQVHCAALHRLSHEQLQASRTLLFVASTYGEGQPPEHARMFLHALPARLDLSHSNIQVLGLGDRRYPLFCQFARQLEQALLERGAQLAWPLLTVDSLHPQDIAAWHASLTQRFSLTFSDTFATPDAFSATLVERICLNPDSTSPSLFLLRFSVHDARWQAGDTLRLRPFNNPQLAVREYSIANACGETLELIVRQAGQCSGWLCQTLAAGEQIVFQVCAKPDFYAVPDAPAILIGAGSGLAGLRGHLQARPAGSHNWLVFGERCPDTDRILAEEAENWLMGGHLQYLNLAFSRDPQQPAYVQDCLRKHQARLVEWLDNGAVLYLCGSLQGMGRSVESMLAELLGQKKFRALQQQGRYRADLY